MNARGSIASKRESRAGMARGGWGVGGGVWREEVVQ